MITATSNVTVVVVAAAFDTTAVAAFSATDTAVFASCRITTRPLPVADNWIDEDAVFAMMLLPTLQRD